jgi:16S rRNA (uracil1498-N3)-methyltransferase
MADRFYINCPLGPGPVVLEGPEAHHLAAVSRVRPGDQVCLFNGDGRAYAAEVVAAERRRVTLRVTDVATARRELPFPLEVAAPLPRGDRAQFLVEKLTELGVTTLVPLATRRSIVNPRDTKLEKLARHVIEASKQCGRNVLMRVTALADWESYCRAARRAGARLMAHPADRHDSTPACAADALTALPTAAFALSAGVRLAVGPEGGFTDEEVSSARQAGWQVLDLGPRILRVETAAIVLAAWTVRTAHLTTGAPAGPSPANH